MKLRDAMPSLDGATIVLNGDDGYFNKDQATFIHFWAVSCHLCKKAMAEINELRDQYAGSLNVISIHMPRLESDFDLESIKGEVAKYDITQPTLVDSERVITNRFENQYVPAYYLFDSAGKLRHFQAGGSSMKMIERRIQRVLNEQSEEA